MNSTMRRGFLLQATFAVAMHAGLIPLSWNTLQAHAQNCASDNSPDTSEPVVAEDLIQQQKGMLIQTVMNKQEGQEKGLFSLVSKLAQRRAVSFDFAVDSQRARLRSRRCVSRRLRQASEARAHFSPDRQMPAGWKR